MRALAPHASRPPPPLSAPHLQVFLFVVHPFDVGDTLVLDVPSGGTDLHRVEEIQLAFTGEQAGGTSCGIGEGLRPASAMPRR